MLPGAKNAPAITTAQRATAESLPKYSDNPVGKTTITINGPFDAPLNSRVVDR